MANDRGFPGFRYIKGAKQLALRGGEKPQRVATRWRGLSGPAVLVTAGAITALGCGIQHSDAPAAATEPVASENQPLTTTTVSIAAAYGSSVEGTGTDCSVAGTGCSAYSAYKVFDVDPQLQTRWSSAFADGQTLTLDLGSAQAFTTMLINWEHASATVYSLATNTSTGSTPPTSGWTTIYTQNNGLGGNETISGLSATTRWVQLQLTKRLTQYGFSIFNISITNSSAPPPPRVAILNNRTTNSTQMFTVLDSSGYLLRTGTTQAGAEQFNQLPTAHGFNLQSTSTLKYVALDSNNQLVANATTQAAAAEFASPSCGSDYVAFQVITPSGLANPYVTADDPTGTTHPNGLAALRSGCTASDNASWEKFEFNVLGGACSSECAATGAKCGDDGCGGSCGTCASGQFCASGQCVTSATCTPNCATTGAKCGSDGCGGTCGSCATGQTCNASGVCVCNPICQGKTCGNDGCGGSCGSCLSGSTCNSSGQCTTTPPTCTPSCSGKSCGPDGCGGSCGTCGSGLTCNTSNGSCTSSTLCNTNLDCPSGELCNGVQQQCVTPFKFFGGSGGQQYFSKSQKRGVPYHYCGGQATTSVERGQKDLDLVKKGVSWTYNWGAGPLHCNASGGDPSDSVASSKDINNWQDDVNGVEFVPMIWGFNYGTYHGNSAACNDDGTHHPTGYSAGTDSCLLVDNDNGAGYCFRAGGPCTGATGEQVTTSTAAPPACYQCLHEAVSWNTFKARVPHGVKYLLCGNEPTLTQQSALTATEFATMYKYCEQMAKELGVVGLVGPAVEDCGSGASCTTAYSGTPYLERLQYLTDFYNGCQSGKNGRASGTGYVSPGAGDCRIDYQAIHSYADNYRTDYWMNSANNWKGSLSGTAATFANKQWWVTEYAGRYAFVQNNAVGWGNTDMDSYETSTWIINSTTGARNSSNANQPTIFRYSQFMQHSEGAKTSTFFANNMTGWIDTGSDGTGAGSVLDPLNTTPTNPCNSAYGPFGSSYPGDTWGLTAFGACYLTHPWIGTIGNNGSANINMQGVNGATGSTGYSVFCDGMPAPINGHCKADTTVSWSAFPVHVAPRAAWSSGTCNTQTGTASCSSMYGTGMSSLVKINSTIP